MNERDEPADARNTRRQFFSWVALGLAAPLGAAALPRRRGDDRASSGSGLGGFDLHADLATAVRRARANGKALLILRIPELTEQEKQMHGLDPDRGGDGAWPSWPPATERGQRLGEILRYADNETLAALGTTEFVCAQDPEIREVLDGPDAGDERRLPSGALLLVELDTGRIRRVLTELPARESAGEMESVRGLWNDEDREKAIAAARDVSREFGRALEAALFGDAAEANGRIRWHRERLGRSLTDFPTPESGSDSDVLRCSLAYFVHARMLDGRKAQAPYFERLAALVRGRFIEADFAGARWANSFGCGADYVHAQQSDQPLGIACGMGSVHPTRSHYLVFRQA